MKRAGIISVVVLSIVLSAFTAAECIEFQDADFIIYTVNPKTQDLRFFWKDDKEKPLGNFKTLKAWLGTKNQKLVFAMNGGMYLKDQSPQGLYIENGKQLAKINSVKEAYGNFYLQPNGIFYITKADQAVVTQTTSYKGNEGVRYATQSGPMLVIDGAIHSAFKDGSKNVHIRNGVGILPNGEILFVMSKQTINLYDFARFFKSKGCKNALYLDGFVSRTYLPEKGWKQLDGNFGVMIGVVE